MTLHKLYICRARNGLKDVILSLHIHGNGTKDFIHYAKTYINKENQGIQFDFSVRDSPQTLYKTTVILQSSKEILILLSKYCI